MIPSSCNSNSTIIQQRLKLIILWVTTIFLISLSSIWVTTESFTCTTTLNHNRNRKSFLSYHSDTATNSRLIDTKIKRQSRHNQLLLYSQNTEKEESPSSAAVTNTNTKKTVKKKEHEQYKHTLAILTLPLSTPDRIANEAILQQSITQTHPNGKLSVILRCRDDDAPSGHSLPSLRRYMSELYSTAWDFMSQNSNPLNIIVYPHQLPNTPPESWLYHRPDLQCIISHDCILGWHSIGSKSSTMNIVGEGEGGLTSHVDAINLDRIGRDLSPIIGIEVSPWLSAAESSSTLQPNVYFLEDELRSSGTSSSQPEQDMVFLEDENVFLEEPLSSSSFLGKSSPKIKDELLFYHVAVGGTFDGMHYGHRKLLTLAVSSVEPMDGKLLIGITSDDMLSSKTLSEYIPPLHTRIQEVKEFLANLAPGLKNRIQILVLENQFGPPAYEEQYDALVLSHETLENGMVLNDIRKQKGLKELKLLCTRRTEGNVMSSTMLRQWRKEEEEI